MKFSHFCNTIFFIFAFISFVFIETSPVLCQDLLKVSIDLRSRTEFWNTLLDFPVYDNPYGFILIRGRSSVDYKYSVFRFHGTIQGASALRLPDNGFSGPGKNYFESSGKKNSQNFSLAELYLKVKYGSFDFSLGRIPLREGAEYISSMEKLISVKERVISERLVGNWDWTAIGRRFDGGSLGIDTEKIYFWISGARVLSGGFDFESAYNPMSIALAIASITLKEDLIKNTEIRLFNILYSDSRKIVKDLYQKDLFINTPGLSLISVNDLGPGEIDFVIWGAYQIGKFGLKNQQAFSFVLESGYEIKEIFLSPWLRIGFAYASGDKNQSDNTNQRFFNLLPTNHKYYGYLDMFSLSNLQNLYLQTMFSYNIFSLELSLHDFSLSSTKDKWVYGSGASSKNKLGYSDIDFSGKKVGNEVDVVFYLNPTKSFYSSFGFSLFFGSSGLREVFPYKSNMFWLFSQINLLF